MDKNDAVARVETWLDHDMAMRPKRRDKLGESYETVPLYRSDLSALVAEVKRLRMQNDELLTENREMQYGPTASDEDLT